MAKAELVALCQSIIDMDKEENRASQEIARLQRARSEEQQNLLRITDAVTENTKVRDALVIEIGNLTRDRDNLKIEVGVQQHKIETNAEMLSQQDQARAELLAKFAPRA